MEEKETHQPEDASGRATGTEAEVCSDIASRQAKGIAKYGQTVAENPIALSQWLQHAYEESLDGSVYLKRAIGKVLEFERELAEEREKVAEFFRENCSQAEEIERLRVALKQADSLLANWAGGASPRVIVQAQDIVMDALAQKPDCGRNLVRREVLEELVTAIEKRDARPDLSAAMSNAWTELERTATEAREGRIGAGIG